uniref:Uncharacterized protein n=1 Tax=Pyramimonas obovata TaxID=1411642 RepID=A0A7S0QTC0_9CHLO
MTNLQVLNNAVTEIKWFRPYVAHRLPALAQLNGVPVSSMEASVGRELFEGLERLPYKAPAAKSAALCPPAEPPAEPNVTPPTWSHPPTQADLRKQEAAEPASKYVSGLMKYAAEAANKIKVMNDLWDGLVEELVTEGLVLDRKERARAG